MTRISALTALTSADSGDTLPILDVSATTTKKITKTAFISDIVDGTLIEDDAVLARHIDWASTGADGGIWWEELGRTTLGSAGDTISVASFAARKYLRLIYSCIPSGQINTRVKFNNDGSALYAFTQSLNFAAGVSALSQTIYSPSISANTVHKYGEINILNLSTDFKIMNGFEIDRYGTDASTSINQATTYGKYASNTQVTRIDVTNVGTGDFAIGSEVIVLGHD